MLIKALYSFLFYFFVSLHTVAQISVAWGSANNSHAAVAMTTDTAGNIYTTGEYIGTVDFDPGFGSQLLSKPLWPYSIGHYLLKLTPNNAFVQVLDLPYEVFTLNLDKEGNLLLGGRFDGTIDFDHGAGNHLVTSKSSEKDFCVVKLDKNLNFQWAYTGGDVYQSEISSIKTDQNNNVFAAGCFSGTVDFDPSTNIVAHTTFDSYSTSFTVKLTPSGDFVWVRTLIDSGLSYPNRVGAR